MIFEYQLNAEYFCLQWGTGDSGQDKESLQSPTTTECFFSHENLFMADLFILCVGMLLLHAYLHTTCEPVAFRGERERKVT